MNVHLDFTYKKEEDKDALEVAFSYVKASLSSQFTPQQKRLSTTIISDRFKRWYASFTIVKNRNKQGEKIFYKLYANARGYANLFY